MILQLDHLAKRFDERVAVNNVSAEFTPASTDCSARTARERPRSCA